MNPKETSPHEEENLKSVEPLFVFAPLVTSIVVVVPEQKASRGSKSKSKDQKDQKESKDPKSNGGKRVASSSGRKSSKHGKVVDGSVTETLVEDLPKDNNDDVLESDSNNDPAGALNSRGTFGVGSVLGRRLYIVECER